MAKLKDIENKVNKLENRVLSSEQDFIAEEVARIAKQDKERYLKKQKTIQVVAICLSVVLSIMILCSAFVITSGIFRYFEYQEGLVIEKEVTEEIVEEYTYEAEAGDYGIATAGDSNCYTIGE